MALVTFPRQFLVDASGSPRVGAKAYVYASGTTTEITTYTTPAYDVPHANPVESVAGGLFPAVYVDPSVNETYKLVITDANDVTLSTDDGIPALGFDQADIAAALNPATDAENAAGVTIVDYSIPNHEKCGYIIPNRYGVNTSPGTTDMTDALLAAKSVAIQALPATVLLRAETYAYTDIGSWAYTGLSLRGVNAAGSILKCTSSVVDHTALLFKAFPNDSALEPFIQMGELCDVKVEGNSVTKYVVRAYGKARFHWSNVIARNARPADGQAFNFSAGAIGLFEHLMCSTDYETQTSQPYFGIYIDTGTRAGVGLGATTDMTFINPIMEGMSVGIHVESGDGNLFLGGTSESCTVYGVRLMAGARWNKFVCHALENPDATADYIDSGLMNALENCYSTNAILLGGDMGEVVRGIHERIEIQSSSCTKNRVRDCVVNYRGAGAGGFFDSGTATEWKNLYDQQAGAYIYPLVDRVSITVGASPFTWTNNTGQYVEVILDTGTISSVHRIRNGTPFEAPVSLPGAHWLAPTDSIQVTYSVAPIMGYLPHNGFQG